MYRSKQAGTQVSKYTKYQAQAGAGTEVNKLGKEVLKVGETE